MANPEVLKWQFKVDLLTGNTEKISVNADMTVKGYFKSLDILNKSACTYKVVYTATPEALELLNVEELQAEVSALKTINADLSKQYNYVVDSFQDHPNRPVIEQLQKENAELNRQLVEATSAVKEVAVMLLNRFGVDEKDL